MNGNGRRRHPVDIDILLALQNFRNSGGDFLAEFFSKMTFLGEINTVLVIMAVVYWCVSKDFGSYLLMGWSGNRIVNGFLKVTACAYRPWIRDERVVPYGQVMTTATGYSFPSGHTMNAATVYGGTAVRKDIPGVIRVILGVVVLLTAFSRCFLGVHTPQDVVIGSIAGMLVMILTVRLMDWIEVHPGKDWLVMCVGIILAAAVSAYAWFKPYPADYDAEGKLIVEGMKMAIDTFKGAGWSSAFLIGWFLERRFVRFSTDIPVMTGIKRLVAGVFGYYVVSLLLVPLLKNWIGGAPGALISCFVHMFYISFLFPWCIKRFEKPQLQMQTQKPQPQKPQKSEMQGRGRIADSDPTVQVE